MNRAQDRIRIGQIGMCHEHAAGKITSLRRLTDVFEIVGVVDERPTPSPLFGGGDPTPFEGLPRLTETELLAVPGLQAVAVETPNDDLVPTALRCAERGLAMHMDKPGGRDLALFRKLLSTCRERNLPFQMGYMFRTNPALRMCLQAVREGWLGEVFEVQASMSHNYGGPAYQEYLGKLPGGIMYNLGCHLVDFVVAMLGRPDRAVPFLKSAGAVADGVQNNCVTILEYPRATVTLRACSLEVDGLARRRFRICGTKGTIELCPPERFDGHPLRMELVLAEPAGGYAAGTHTVDFGIQDDRYAPQFLELAAIIRGEMENPRLYAHDELVQEVVLAAAGLSTL